MKIGAVPPGRCTPSTGQLIRCPCLLECNHRCKLEHRQRDSLDGIQSLYRVVPFWRCWYCVRSLLSMRDHALQFSALPPSVERPARADRTDQRQRVTPCCVQCVREGIGALLSQHDIVGRKPWRLGETSCIADALASHIIVRDRTRFTVSETNTRHSTIKHEIGAREKGCSSMHFTSRSRRTPCAGPRQLSVENAVAMPRWECSAIQANPRKRRTPTTALMGQAGNQHGRHHGLPTGTSWDVYAR